MNIKNNQNMFMVILYVKFVSDIFYYIQKTYNCDKKHNDC